MTRKLWLTIAAAALLLAEPIRAQQLAAAPEVPAAAAADPARRKLNLRVFDTAWSKVDQLYYDASFGGVDWKAARARYRPLAEQATDEQALYDVLEQMLDLLRDQHLVATSPALLARMASRGQPKASFGMSMRAADGVFTIADVWPGGPAEAAGVQPDWRIEAVNGQRFGPTVTPIAGVPHQVTLRDDQGAVRELTMTPQVLTMPERNRVHQPRPGVFVIAFEQFDDGRAEWFHQAMSQIPADASLVIDLRGNVGGKFGQVTRTLGCFLPAERPVAYSVSRRSRTGSWEVKPGCPRTFTGPMAVLVDRYSTSGAEIFPAAIREAGRGVVVGQRTAGGVLASQDERLPDGGRLRISRFNLVTAGGQRLERVGLEPDVQAVTTYADRRAGRDPALDAAIEAMQSRARPS